MNTMYTSAGAAAALCSVPVLNLVFHVALLAPGRLVSLLDKSSLNKEKSTGPILSWSHCLMRPKERATTKACLLVCTGRLLVVLNQQLSWFSYLCWFVVPPAPEIDETAAMQLAEMGFPLEACRKAVYYTGNMGPEMAFNWIIAHMEEPGKMTVFNGADVWRDKCT